MLRLVPEEPGVYVLLIEVSRDTVVRTIGRAFAIERGFYAYVGSALGRGGLYSRVKRYLSRSKRPFWHIDFLLNDPGARLTGLLYKVVSSKNFDWETRVASVLAERLSYVEGFGCSDKRGNRSHLFKCGNSLEECLESVGVLINAGFSCAPLG